MKEIPLTKGYVALVDDEDYERLMRYKWHALVKSSGCVYAKTNARCIDGKWRTFLMHRMILGYPPKNKQVDHIDGDGRNNQKSNLRLSDHTHNKQARRRKPKGASSKFRGVCRYKAGNKWRAQIAQAGNVFYIGDFESEEDAARARDAKAMDLFGPHAHLNFPI